MSPPDARDWARALWVELVPDAQGLVPCVTQDLRTRAVLMVAWVSEAALIRTLETGYAVYWSRSRNALWEKGVISGNRQRLVHVRLDNDKDTLMYLVDAQLPAGNDGSDTYFNYRRHGGAWVWDPLEIRPQGELAVSAGEAETLAGQLQDEVERFCRSPDLSTDEGLNQAADILETLTRSLKLRGLSLKEVLVHLEARVLRDGA